VIEAASRIGNAIDNGARSMILAAGLSPAWQRILRFEALEPGEVNRAAGAWSCASGKVINVARACHALGADVHGLTVVGGPAGAAIADELAASGIGSTCLPTAAPTRTCTTILETGSGRTTELVENAGPVTSAELAEVVRVFRELSKRASIAVLSGSLPPGAPATFYSEVLDGFRGVIILDARGDELLAALRHRPLLVKPNRKELEQTLQRPLPDDESLWGAMRELNQRGAQWVLVTAGPDAAWLSSSDELLPLRPFPVAQVVNPIGCGDCVAAGIAVGIDRGESLVDAVRLGFAAACVNAGRLLPAELEASAVNEVLTAECG
jgi:tagatose 6-phosphate kinase